MISYLSLNVDSSTDRNWWSGGLWGEFLGSVHGSTLFTLNVPVTSSCAKMPRSGLAEHVTALPADSCNGFCDIWQWTFWKNSLFAQYKTNFLTMFGFVMQTGYAFERSHIQKVFILTRHTFKQFHFCRCWKLPKLWSCRIHCANKVCGWFPAALLWEVCRVALNMLWVPSTSKTEKGGDLHNIMNFQKYSLRGQQMLIY